MFLIRGRPAGGGSATSMTTARRTTGFAPLGIVFDALDSGSGVVQPPTTARQMEWHWIWDFGDDTGATWVTGHDRNKMLGPVAAHYYEQAGTYTVTLTVIDHNGDTFSYEQAVSPSAFDGTAYYVAANGDDANDGLSESTPFATIGAGFTALNGGDNRRLLLRRGDTWSGLATQDIQGTAKEVAAYGTGNKPVLDFPDGNHGIRTRGQDHRVTDLTLTGNYVDTAQSGVGGWTAGGTDRLVCGRVDVSGFRVGVIWSNFENNVHPDNCFFECDISNNHENGFYCGGNHMAFVGCTVGSLEISHCLRMWRGQRNVIASCEILEAGGTRTALKLHADEYDGTESSTSHDVNIYDTSFSAPNWVVVLGPQNELVDERVQRIHIHRCRFYTVDYADTYQLLRLEGPDVIVRNCLFFVTGGVATCDAIVVSKTDTGPAPNRIRVYNCTVYRGDAGGETEGVVFESPGGTSHEVFNLLVSADQSTEVKLVQNDDGAASWTGDGNLITTASDFVDPANEDLRLASGAAAVDAGVDTSPYVRDDYDGTSRPQGAAYDVGAFERV